MDKKIAYDLAGESTTRIMALDGTTAEDVINTRNTQKFNEQVDKYAERFASHSNNISDYADKVNSNMENIEILPIGNYLLITPFNENPFQRIVRDSKSGLIIDTGGFAPEIKNTDSGELQEEEQMIKVGVVQAVGPGCKWVKEGDAVFATKVSLVPVPFYKQNLQLLCENRVLAVVGESLTKRFNDNK